MPARSLVARAGVDYVARHGEFTVAVVSVMEIAYDLQRGARIRHGPDGTSVATIALAIGLVVCSSSAICTVAPSMRYPPMTGATR